jgi:hypothetical protein
MPVDNYLVKVDYCDKDNGNKIFDDSAILKLDAEKNMNEQIKNQLPSDERVVIKITAINKV